MTEEDRAFYTDLRRQMAGQLAALETERRHVKAAIGVIDARLGGQPVELSATPAPAFGPPTATVPGATISGEGIDTP